MAQLVVLIVLAYLLATYGFWTIVLLAIGSTVAFVAIAYAIAGPFRPLEQPKVCGKRKGPTKSRTGSMLLANHDGPLGRIPTGLVIDEPWISKIMGGEKDWEMRSTATTKRERIALIRKGSLSIIGVATISDVQGPLTDSQISDSFARHCVPTHMIGKWRYAWVLRDVVKLNQPISYLHRKGAVTFVTLDSAASLAVSAADWAEA